MVFCLEQSADLHTAQPMPLPLTVSCSSKIHIGFTFLVPAHLGSPRQRAIKWVCVQDTSREQTDFMMKERVQWAAVNSFIDQHKTLKFLSLTQAHQHQDRRVTIPPANDISKARRFTLVIWVCVSANLAFSCKSIINSGLEFSSSK